MRAVTKEKRLDPQDLKQFQLRRNSLEQAATMFQMVQAGYGQWANEIRKKYKLNGQFSIDWETGAVVTEVKDGRSNTKRKTKRRTK